MMTPDQQHDQRLAESARYALLRRLAPMLRHNLAGALQPLSMLSMLLEKRLQSATPDLVAAVKGTGQLAKVAREASRDCMDLMTWLAPGPSVYVTVAAGVEDATGLVATELSFRGFSVINKVGEVGTQLPANLMRSVFMASLLCLTDAATAPASVLLEASVMDDELVMKLSLAQAEGDVFGSGEPAYRKIDWADIKALGKAESVEVTQAPDWVELTFGAALIRTATP